MTALAVFGAAIMALVLLYGVSLLFMVLGGKMASTGIPGISQLGDLMKSWGNAQAAFWSSTLGIALSPLAGLFHYLHVGTQTSNAQAINHAHAVHDKMWQIRHDVIPQHTQYAINQATAAATAEAQALQQRLLHTGAMLGSDIASEVQTRAQQVRALTNDLTRAENWAAQVAGSDAQAAAVHAVAVARAELGQAVATLERQNRALATTMVASAATLRADIGKVEAWAGTGLRGVATDAAAMANTAQHDAIKSIDAAVPVALAPTWTGVRDAANGAITGVAGQYPGVAPSLQTFPETVPLSVAGALAASMSATAALSTYVNECGLPMCKNLSTFGRDIAGILNMVGSGELLAFLLGLISDPTAAAQDVATVVGDLSTGVEDVIRSVAGG